MNRDQERNRTRNLHRNPMQNGGRGNRDAFSEAARVDAIFPDSTRDVVRAWVRGMLPSIAEPLIREEIARLRDEELRRVPPGELAEAVRDWLEPRIDSMARQTIRDMVVSILPDIAASLIEKEIQRIREGG
ncbi:MAG: hypothetical protein HQL76_03125 [Magnetococcales bacterium]|nr:hypothetical protein [Magnetococcales bacterium]